MKQMMTTFILFAASLDVYCQPSPIIPATQAEVNAGTNNTKYVTPATLTRASTVTSNSWAIVSGSVAVVTPAVTSLPSSTFTGTHPLFSAADGSQVSLVTDLTLNDDGASMERAGSLRSGTGFIGDFMSHRVTTFATSDFTNGGFGFWNSNGTIYCSINRNGTITNKLIVP